MNNGGYGSDPSTHTEIRDAFVPTQVSIVHGDARNPEIDGASISVIEFTGKPMGSTDETPDQTFKLVMPNESFVDLASTLSRSALSLMAHKAAE